uniref:F-box domain-containing protein n=1 Tax=Anabas testudineus TaxID=64144 RepID=A0A3Q1KBJ2_ANATE
MSDYDSDLSDDCWDGSSWESLPDVCLRCLFTFLSDRDRRSAALVCHHWHNVMRSPSLWRCRYFHFSGRLSKFRQSEYCSAVTYARYLGVYLERLEVCVCPPRRSLVAQRLEQVISGVRAPLHSLSIVKLELDRPAWTPGLRNSLINSLIRFIQKVGSKLSSICLSRMRNNTFQGLELLSALSNSQSRFSPRYCISSLGLEGFFSSATYVHLNSDMPCILRNLRGLTDLRLSYSCVSDQLLIALHRDGSPLQKLSLHCALNEPHQQLVSGDSWEALASSCPDLQIKFTVDQIINTDCLARMLLREIPLTEYGMTAFYSPDVTWSAKPVLSNLLPQYRRSLQFLTLDLTNCSEDLDEELLELVKVCKRLEQLRIWAFLEIRTVERLLTHTTCYCGHYVFQVRIYSVNEDTSEEEDQLEDMLSSYRHLPPELQFYAILCPYV